MAGSPLEMEIKLSLYDRPEIVMIMVNNGGSFKDISRA
jgi:hypothetical protein